MDSHADLLAILAVIVLGGKLAGQFSQRLGFPTAVGKITLGLVIGPAMFGFIHHDGPVVDLAEIGVVVLMFLAGVETDTETMRKAFVMRDLASQLRYKLFQQKRPQP